MTLDRTKKYTVGTVPFKSIGEDRKSHWAGDFGGTVVYLTDEEFLKLNPVEVEEPLKWSFETGNPYVSTDGHLFDQNKPVQVNVGNWRHEVVSTRIG